MPNQNQNKLKGSCSNPELKQAMRYLHPQFFGLHRCNFGSQVSSYLRVLQSALSPFEGVVERADEIKIRELEELQSIPVAELIESGMVQQPDDLLERAASAGDDYLYHELSLRQGILNLFAIGLHHLFEQQMAFILKLASGPLELEAVIDKFKSAAKERGIDVKEFASWPEIKELTDVGNCAKHGEGRSCDNLRKTRPELLGEAASINHSTRGLHELGVTQPLFGEHLCVTEQDLLRYGDKIDKFWEEFQTALRAAGQHRG